MLSSALQRPDLASKYDKASQLLGTLSKRAKPFENVPHIGEFVKLATKGANIVAKGLASEADAERDLAHIKDEISEVLRANGRRIVVILDDIDRLSSVEIRQMFQLVKAVADFSNVIYLLAFDKTIVVPALEEVQKGDGEAYLEKIINVPIVLPAITESQLQKLLIDRLNSFSERNKDYDWDGSRNKHLAEVFQPLSKLFTTIRQLDRFVNLLSFSEGLIAGEVDYADFLGLSALQTTSPDVYTFVRDSPLLFIDTPMSRMLGRENGDELDRRAIDEPLQSVPQPLRDNVLTLLKEMFPKVERVYENRGYSDSFYREWKRRRRVCASLENFQTYFGLEVPSDAISAARMREVLASLANGTFGAEFQKLIDDGMALAFLEELKNHVDEEYVTEHVRGLVAVLLNAGDVFSEDMRQFPIKMDGPTLVMQVVYQATHRLPSEEERYECLRSAMGDARDSLFSSLQTISVEDQTHGRYKLGGRESPEKQLVSASHLDELERLGVSKIESWAAAGRLATHPKLAYILYRWANWGGGENLKRYILESLDDAAFVALMYRLAVGASMERFRGKPMLTAEVVDPLLPLSDVQRRLDVIGAHEDTLSNEHRKMLATLLSSNHGDNNANADSDFVNGDE